MSDPAWDRFRGHVLAEMLPKLIDSAMTVSLCPSDNEGVGDVKYWVELGASIMLDKPIIVVAHPNRVIPERLRRVADEVITADLGSEAGIKELGERLALVAQAMHDG
jgi:hypothetical protein